MSNILQIWVTILSSVEADKGRPSTTLTIVVDKTMNFEFYDLAKFWAVNVITGVIFYKIEIVSKVLIIMK